MKIAALLPKLAHLPAFDEVRHRLENRGDILPLGLPKAGRPPVLARLAQENAAPIVLITAKVEQVPVWRQELQSWLGDDMVVAADADANETHRHPSVIRFPEPTPLPYDRAPWSNSSRHGRLSVLTRLMAGQHPFIPATDNPAVIITSARALLQQTLPKRNFLKGMRVLRLGQIIDLAQLEKTWQGLGYNHTTVVENPGQYSRRGGILDIFPAGGAKYPTRIELFGDEIDTLRLFDPATQRTVHADEAIKRVLVPPAREAIPADAAELGLALQMDAPEKADELPAWQDDIPALAAGEPTPNAEFYLPLIYHRPDSLLHYLPEGSMVFVDDWVALQKTVDELHEQAAQLEGEQPSLPSGYPNPLFLWNEIAPLLAQHRVIVLGDHLPPDERDDNRPLTDLAAAFHPGPRYGGQMKPLTYQLQYAQRTGEPTVIVSRQADRLQSVWLDAGSQEPPPDNGRADSIFNVKTAADRPAPIHFINATLSEGFTLNPAESGEPILNLLTDAEIFGWNRPTPRRRTRSRTYAPETYFSDLEAGDYVVHSEHGIARFLGLVVRAIGGSDREYLKLEYADSDVLYEPVHNADRLSKWIGLEEFAPRLNRLGDRRWTSAKKRAQRDIDEMADDLLELYAARETVSGHAFAEDGQWQAELEAGFPYQETDDQLQAIEEVKRDMEAPRPMDRLICGDVGYGKTEVALRAAFKAVVDGRQVAILVPTTVLAQQHFQTFTERLAPFPMRVDMLSRFRTGSQQRKTIKDLKKGLVDIVIGTHRLTSDDVSFKNLGLLIIDEEQRFGVGQKEKLKQLRTEIDVLTMTATPIPRTMHLALSGLRDISVINTAPAERLPVQTFVGPMDDQLIRRAILRELDRGGQVYFVHNRVQTIRTVARRMEELVPEAIIAVGHGQMSERELEATMNGFTDGHIDVLISTTIVESGLDIPNANTLIVHRADEFGLAQLYQLRGRVGRGAHRAYAYFFHRPWRQLTAESKARLEAIADATHLGAGYTIAMRDLEIRGAGDILGSGQSGHIAAIGFDLYTRMLARAVSVRKAAREGKVIEMELPANTLIDLPIATYIPTDYVPDAGLRLRLYRRMATLVTLDDIDDMGTELTDRFGPIPEPTEQLLYQLRIKALALRGGIRSVTTNPRQFRIVIDGLDRINRRALRQFIGDHVRVSRNGIWMERRMSTREWQVLLVQTLEKLATYFKK